MNNLHLTFTSFENESRILKETNSLIKYEIVNHVYIVALHKDGLQENEIVDSKRSVWRIKLQTRAWPKILIVQLIKYLEFCGRITLYAKKKQIAMVNIHSLDLLPLGLFLKIMLNAKLIYDTHELETESNGLKGVRKYLAKCLERLGIHFVDHIFVVSDSIADHYMKQYNIARPTVVLNAPVFSSPENNNLLRKKLGIKNDVILCLYQGGLMKERGVESILETFTGNPNYRVADREIVIIFMGYGPLEAKVKRAAEKYTNVFFHPAVPPDVILDYTASADMGIHLIPNTCLNHNFCMPNKLFEYIMAGLPVVVSDMLEMVKFVTDNKLGTVVIDRTPEAILTAIEKLYKQDSCMLHENALKAGKLYSWEVQEEKMILAYKTFLNL